MRIVSDFSSNGDSLASKCRGVDVYINNNNNNNICKSSLHLFIKKISEFENVDVYMGYLYTSTPLHLYTSLAVAL